jgi:hypothetical protein
MGLSSWMMSARRQHPQLRRCALADLRRCARGVGGAARKARGGPGRGESGELVPAPCSSSARRGSRMAAGGLRPVRCSSSARRGGARCCCSTSSSSAWPVVTDVMVKALFNLLELRLASGHRRHGNRSVRRGPRAAHHHRARAASCSSHARPVPLVDYLEPLAEGSGWHGTATDAIK